MATQSEYNPNAPPALDRGVERAHPRIGASWKTLRIRHIPSHVESKLILARRDHARVTFAHPARWPEPRRHRGEGRGSERLYRSGDGAALINTRVGLNGWSSCGFRRVFVDDAGAGRSSGGPWNRRVDVQDRTGATIGASLLDIDGAEVQTGAQTATYKK